MDLGRWIEIVRLGKKEEKAWSTSTTRGGGVLCPRRSVAGAACPGLKGRLRTTRPSPEEGGRCGASHQGVGCGGGAAEAASGERVRVMASVLAGGTKKRVLASKNRREGVAKVLRSRW